MLYDTGFTRVASVAQCWESSLAHKNGWVTINTDKESRWLTHISNHQWINGIIYWSSFTVQVLPLHSLLLFVVVLVLVLKGQTRIICICILNITPLMLLANGEPQTTAIVVRVVFSTIVLSILIYYLLSSYQLTKLLANFIVQALRVFALLKQ